MYSDLAQNAILPFFGIFQQAICQCGPSCKFLKPMLFQTLHYQLNLGKSFIEYIPFLHVFYVCLKSGENANYIKKQFRCNVEVAQKI